MRSQWLLDTGYPSRDSEPVHLEVQAAAGEAERAGCLRNVARRALERALDHLALEAFNRYGERHATSASA